jgi:hypothetical protein
VKVNKVRLIPALTLRFHFDLCGRKVFFFFFFFKSKVNERCCSFETSKQALLNARVNFSQEKKNHTNTDKMNRNNAEVAATAEKKYLCGTR